MFRVGAVLGGMAKRGSEILAEERKEAMETVNDQLKVWTEMGLPKARARKEQLRTRNTIYDSLSKEGFSNVQIAVIIFHLLFFILIYYILLHIITDPQDV